MADQLPVQRNMAGMPALRLGGPSGTGPEPHDGPNIGEVWGAVRRNWWVILGCTVIATAAAVTYAIKATPVYEAATTIRVETAVPNLPGIFRELANGGMGVGTEVEVLKSRSLAEDAINELGLRLVVTAPRGVPRSRLLTNVRVAPDAPPAKYRVETRAGGGSVVCRLTDSAAAGECGERVLTAGGIAFTATTEASRYDALELSVQPLGETMTVMRENISVSLPNKDAQIVMLTYRSTDPQLVWQVPNVMARRFIARRQETQTGQATSAVAFLRSQLDTLAIQLRNSENQLREFRERERVVDPTTEASTQVTQFATLQAQRSMIEGERSALARLMNEVQDSARRTQVDQPSPYRRLLAFPTLISNQSASDRLAALAVLEDQRATLLSRRTMSDVDVQALTERIKSIEEDLRLTVTTYAQGLANQVGSLDSSISQYGAQLARVPERQLIFARLQRQPKVLEDMYGVLQTRLKEAEISQAVQDNSLRVVDPAVQQLLPVSPKRKLIVLAGLFGGLLLGVGGAFVREFLDRSIHTRTDIQVATGLPVLGLIPRIPGRGKYALIAERVAKARLFSRQRSQPPAKSGEHPGPRPHYTFLQVDDVTVGKLLPPSQEPVLPAVPDLSAMMTIPGTGTLVTEAYGTLQTNLLYAGADTRLRTVVFTSALPGEGKTTNAANLALTIAQRGVKVVLVDADVRRGVVHQLFGVKQEPGLSDVLAGTVRLAEALHVARIEEGGSLHFLTSGRPPRNPVAMLESTTMRQLITHLEDEFEAVILDSPPVNMLTDASILAANADGVVVVVRAGGTQKAALEYAMQQLHLTRARVLGVVLNDVDFRRDVGYDSTYQYYQYEAYTTRSKS